MRCSWVWAAPGCPLLQGETRGVLRLNPVPTQESQVNSSNHWGLMKFIEVVTDFVPRSVSAGGVGSL